MCKQSRVRQESPCTGPVALGRGTTAQVNMYVGNAILNKYILISFTEGGYSFRIFNCNRELIPDCWRSYRESLFCLENKLFGNGLSKYPKDISIK